MSYNEIEFDKLKKEIPRGWVQAKYSTATHYLIYYLAEPDCKFRKRWELFNSRWEDARGDGMRIKQEQTKIIHQGFGDQQVRDTVMRAFMLKEHRVSGVIDILRLDRILIAENIQPLISLDPEGFVAKTPGSVREKKYRQEGIPKEITDYQEALTYIYKNGPPISETKSTKKRGGRDPRIKVIRCFSEWIRWVEEDALKNLIKEITKEDVHDMAEVNVEAVFENLR